MNRAGRPINRWGPEPTLQLARMVHEGCQRARIAEKLSTPDHEHTEGSIKFKVTQLLRLMRELDLPDWPSLIAHLDGTKTAKPSEITRAKIEARHLEAMARIRKLSNVPPSSEFAAPYAVGRYDHSGKVYWRILSARFRYEDSARIYANEHGLIVEESLFFSIDLDKSLPWLVCAPRRRYLYAAREHTADDLAKIKAVRQNSRIPRGLAHDTIFGSFINEQHAREYAFIFDGEAYLIDERSPREREEDIEMDRYRREMLPFAPPKDAIVQVEFGI